MIFPFLMTALVMATLGHTTHKYVVQKNPNCVNLILFFFQIFFARMPLHVETQI